MSKIKLPLRRYNLVLLFVCLFFSLQAKEDAYVGSYSKSEIKERLDALAADVDLKLTPDVKKYLDQFVVYHKNSSETLIGRSLYYFPIIEEKIYEKEMPSELKYLAIIESSLKPTARSRAGASGMWQFMRTTGKMYGLQIDNIQDERRNVEKSTDAALEYLSDLHKRFGDWTLALAAYNCGPGNVRKAMRRSGGKDYWSIRNHLPRETRNYVPKFIAMTYMMNYYTEHGLTPSIPQDLFETKRKAVFFEKISFEEIAEITGLTIESVSEHNPEYVGKYLPKSESGIELVLPISELYTFLAEKNAFDQLVPDERFDKKETRVASQVFEKRDYIDEIDALQKIDGLLANLELTSSLETFSVEIKLTPSVIEHAENSYNTVGASLKVEKRNPRRNEKRKLVFRKDRATAVND